MSRKRFKRDELVLVQPQVDAAWTSARYVERAPDHRGWHRALLAGTDERAYVPTRRIRKAGEWHR